MSGVAITSTSSNSLVRGTFNIMYRANS